MALCVCCVLLFFVLFPLFSYRLRLSRRGDPDRHVEEREIEEREREIERVLQREGIVWEEEEEMEKENEEEEEEEEGRRDDVEIGHWERKRDLPYVVAMEGGKERGLPLEEEREEEGGVPWERGREREFEEGNENTKGRDVRVKRRSEGDEQEREREMKKEKKEKEEREREGAESALEKTSPKSTRQKRRRHADPSTLKNLTTALLGRRRLPSSNAVSASNPIHLTPKKAKEIQQKALLKPNVLECSEQNDDVTLSICTRLEALLNPQRGT